MSDTDKVLTDAAQEAGMDQKTQEGLLKGMAVMIAEYEVMKAKLVDLGWIHDAPPPLRWCTTGAPLVDIEAVIRKHMEGR